VEKLTTAMSESLTAFFANESRVRDLQELQRLRDAVASGTPVTPPPAAAAPPAP
jgi:HAMP domain-containing protein